MSMYLDVIGRYSIGGFTDQTHINIDFFLVFPSLKYRSTNMNESFGEMLTEWGGLSGGRGGGGSGKDGTYLIVFKFGRQEGWRVQGLFSEALLLYIYFFNSHPFSKNKEKNPGVSWVWWVWIVDH